MVSLTITADQSRGLDAPQISNIDQEILAQCAERINRIGQDLRHGTLALGSEAHQVNQTLSKYRRGLFARWIQNHCNVSASTIYSAMQVYSKFGNFPTVGKFETKALLVLSYNSTPESARAEARRRAESGEQITTSVAKALVANAKSAQPTEPPLEQGQTDQVINELEEKADAAECQESQDQEAIATVGSGKASDTGSDTPIIPARESDDRSASDISAEAAEVSRQYGLEVIGDQLNQIFKSMAGGFLNHEETVKQIDRCIELLEELKSETVARAR